MDDWVLYIARGSLTTLAYASLSCGFGLIVAFCLVGLKFSKIRLFEILSAIYVSIFRGTPIIVQLSMIYFALPMVTGCDISAFTSGILAFSLNSGAYLSETIRTGILSVDKGQKEAALALGLSKKLIMKDIILPQALRNILPALVNEVINLLKESAIVSVIGESDIMRRAQIVTAAEYSYFAPYLVAALCYYILVLILTFFAKLLENKLKIL